MDRAEWSLWVVLEWICPARTDRKGVRERVRISECYGGNTGFVERRLVLVPALLGDII